ncbi:CBP80/20-dependent translation initiation factor isoform X2 [Ascaphus truei]|uniref:CBP80/20-dependent translation initiation factor isoform X2 n=1 Tax=Ascaphus truei TaxID=8439 RepID=UPI003F59E959
MENSSVASASSEAGSSRSQEIEELERFIDSYVLEYQVQGLLTDKTEGDGESDKTQSNISQWTVECTEQLDGNRSSPKERGSSHNHNQNGNKDGPLDMLGTDIWASSTFDSISGATWDLQPEKLDFTQLHRKLRNSPKHPLPQIDREGFGKGKCEDGEEINLNDIEKVLPIWQGYHPLPHEAEIAHTKKLFRRRRNDRRKQQKTQGGNKQPPPLHPQHNEHQQVNVTAKPSTRDHQKQYQGGQVPQSSGKQGHHGYSQNRRWHHNQKHPPNDKDLQRNAKETESLKIEDASVCTVHIPLEMTRSTEATERQSQQTSVPESETRRKDSIQDRTRDRPKVNLLQSSKDRLRRRLKEKEEVAVAATSPQKTKMDKLIEILSSMRNNSSDVDYKLTTFMEEAQNSANSEEMLSEIVKTIYQKAVTDRSFAHTAAKLCDKMALFMVEGTKFRSLLLNMLQFSETLRNGLECLTATKSPPSLCHNTSRHRSYFWLDTLLQVTSALNISLPVGSEHLAAGRISPQDVSIFKGSQSQDTSRGRRSDAICQGAHECAQQDTAHPLDPRKPFLFLTCPCCWRECRVSGCAHAHAQ